MPNAKMAKTLSSADIARLANVSRSAVSNWRKRKPDFPSPINPGERFEVFPQQDILDWFAAHEIEIHELNPREELVAVFNNIQRTTKVNGLEIVEFILTCALSAVNGQASRIPAGFSASDANALTLAFKNLEGDAIAESADYLINRVGRYGGQEIHQFGSLQSKAVESLASIASSFHPHSVLDLTCGIGAILTRIAEGNTQTSQLDGFELNPLVARIATLRGELHRTGIKVTTCDTLHTAQEPHQKYDMVVAEPPLSLRLSHGIEAFDPRYRFVLPGKSNVDTAWPQIALSHLNDDGHAVLLLTDGFFFANRRDALQLRNELLTRGLVKAVIALGSGAAEGTVVGTSILVLAKNGKCNTVRFIDISSTEPVDVDFSQLLHANLDSLKRSNGLAAVEIKNSILLENKADLSAIKWTNSAAILDSVYSSMSESTHIDISKLAKQLVAATSSLPPVPKPHDVRNLSIQELMDIDAIRQFNARGRNEDRNAVGPQHISKGIPQDQWPSRSTEDKCPLPVQVGDILVPEIGKPKAVVVERDDLSAGNLLCVLRPNPEVLEPGYLALMLAGEWNARFTRGSKIRRLDIRSFEIPVLPLEQQQQLALSAQQFSAAQSILSQVEDILDRHANDWANSIWRSGRQN